MTKLESAASLGALFESIGIRVLDLALGEDSILVEGLEHEGASRYAGVTSDGDWALILSTTTSYRRLASLDLESLSVTFGVERRLRLGHTSELRRISIVKCKSSNAVVRSIFVAFCIALIEALPQVPTDDLVESEINKWASLFWRLSLAPKNDVVGLIGELTILSQVSDVGLWVKAWHQRNSDNLDFAFSTPPLSLEVKATTGQQRVHEVSLTQMTNKVGAQSYFASVIVELRESGTTVGDLVHSIETRIADTEEHRVFLHSLTDVCGSSLPEFLGTRYSRVVSESSLRIYPAHAIPMPVISMPLPAGVSRVRFRSDFTSVAPVGVDRVLGYEPD